MHEYELENERLIKKQLGYDENSLQEVGLAQQTGNSDIGMSNDTTSLQWDFTEFKVYYPKKKQ